MSNSKKAKGKPRAKGGGRKLRLNEQLIKKMEELFKIGCTDKAVYNGICLSSHQFYLWKDKGEEALKKREEEGIEALTANEVLYALFRETMDKALSDFQAEALRLVKKASLKTWQAGCWLLERRFPEQFAIRNRGGIDMKHEGKLKIEFVNVTAEQQKQVKEGIKERAEKEKKRGDATS